MGIEQFSRKFSASPKELEDIRAEALAGGKTAAEADALVEAFKAKMEGATARAGEKFGSQPPQHGRDMDIAA